MYGTLDAAERWGEHYAATLTNAGFKRGIASPCHFHRPEKDIWLLVHGDDFVVVARQAGRDYIEQTLKSVYEVKVDIAGPEAQDPKEIKILGRIVTFTPEGVQYEPDPGHMEKAIHELGLEESKGVATPGAKDETTVTAVELLERRRCYAPPRLVTHQGPTEAEAAPDGWPPLTGSELSRYQSLAASLNYFALDRLDIMYAVKELMRKLSSPNEDDWQKLKRVARYLITVPRLVMHFPWQPLADTLTVYTDSDHAGCLRTRKSTSGGVVVWGHALLKAWSRTQTLIALSSGESELAAVTKAAAEGLGIQSVLADFGITAKLELHSDATAAIGICKRQGLGRVRHLATADLWVQQKLRSRELKLYKLPGKDNPSDLMTKHKTAPEASRFMTMLGIKVLTGRPALAPSRVPKGTHPGGESLEK